MAIISRRQGTRWGGELTHFCQCASTLEARYRQGLPYDLANVMEDVRRMSEEVEEVSIGLDGDWFLRTNARHGTYSFPRLHLAHSF